MELGPRDRLSQSFYFEMQKGRVFDNPVLGKHVHLDYVGQRSQLQPLLYLNNAEKTTNKDVIKSDLPFLVINLSSINFPSDSIKRRVSREPILN